jgi:hypothetical protein
MLSNLILYTKIEKITPLDKKDTVFDLFHSGPSH